LWPPLLRRRRGRKRRRRRRGRKQRRQRRLAGEAERGKAVVGMGGGGVRGERADWGYGALVGLEFGFGFWLGCCRCRGRLIGRAGKNKRESESERERSMCTPRNHTHRQHPKKTHSVHTYAPAHTHT
jgi:hypothetical protein